MLEGSEAAAQFIDNLIDSKLAGTEIESDVRETLHNNLRERLENQIIQAVLAQLDDHQQRELEHLIDANKNHEIETYLENHGVNLNQVLAGAMVEFQAAYLGA
jgi:hypothetical protein